MVLTKQHRRQRIKKRIRKTISGTLEKPRLTVFRSNKEIYVQLIDDTLGKTIVSTSSKAKDIQTDKMNKTKVASLVGQKLAEKALESGITNCSFDRNGYLYHGRVKSLAEGAREKGLKF